ncbi:hypothetical protein D9758_012991 [Tetrapyrgos nigripes]|uniref:Retrotransposon gag domain-containing protein n=1 Tax=Tetrapyrgos nigripes TaxID=182062 RepID=A0A8H5CKN5_9AGAR|nr:hypothetical protein D9758_012991 [Tetrapyrgos nigripes]
MDDQGQTATPPNTNPQNPHVQIPHNVQTHPEAPNHAAKEIRISTPTWQISAADWKLIHVQKYVKDGWPNWDKFLKEFNETFSPIDKQGDTQIKLWNLRQTGRVDNYISELQLLAAHSGITEDSALIKYFIKGLNPKIVENMFDRETVPTQVNDWYKYAAIYDSNYQ